MPLMTRRCVAVALMMSLIAAGRPLHAETLTVTFAHVNDVYQHDPVDGRGGLAGLGTLLDAERARASGPFFFTFGGDLFSPSLTSSVTKGAHMVAIFNALGTDVAVLGNHEFDFGSAVARERIGESRFPWLGANVLGTDGRPFPGAGTAMIERGGVKVGFVGGLTTETAQLAVDAADVTFTPVEPALRAGADDLRRRGADIVVALTHQDLADDERMARSVPGIDLILGGHDHDVYAVQQAGAPIVKAGSDARWLAVVELRIVRPDPGQAGRPRVVAVAWRIIPNVGVQPSPAIAPIIAAIDTNLDGILSQPLTRLEAPLDSRASVVRTREAALGDVVADALRRHFGADVALFNGGGLRGNRVYPEGYMLTRRDLLAEMPFNNAVELVEVSGATLRAIFEHGLSDVEDAAGRFPQISGATVVYDPAAPPGHRVTSVRVGNQPLVAERSYRLATTDYLASGGDGYAMLKAAKVLVDASGGPLLVNVTADAIARSPTLAAAPDGRIGSRRE